MIPEIQNHGSARSTRVTIIFGDNANLTSSLAKSVGALLRPVMRDDPKVAVLREEMERFIRSSERGL